MRYCQLRSSLFLYIVREYNNGVYSEGIAIIYEARYDFGTPEGTPCARTLTSSAYITTYPTDRDGDVGGYETVLYPKAPVSTDRIFEKTCASAIRVTIVCYSHDQA